MNRHVTKFQLSLQDYRDCADICVVKFKAQEIRKSFKISLPGVDAHNKVMSYERPSIASILSSDKDPRISAVVVLVFPRNGEWNIVLLKRHDYEGVHSGQVGLPGGSLDAGETPAMAALRELEEETGLRLSRAEPLSPLTPLYIPPSNFIVHPYFCIIEKEPDWDFDSYEVKRALFVPIRDITNSDSLQDVSVPMSGSRSRIKVKAFILEDEIVWGATAMIISECKEILLTLAP